MADQASLAPWDLERAAARLWPGKGDQTRCADLVSYLTVLRAGAAVRDYERRLPRAEIAAFAALSLGALRLPVDRGGAGWDVDKLLRFIHLLGAADANVAHAVRNHFLFVELLLTFPDSPWRTERLRRIADGAILGEAHGERHGASTADIAATLRRSGDGYVLNGAKFYSTGSLFADHIWISAKDEAGRLRWMDIPANRAGIQLIDDWDGFGQKLTASGSTLLEDVVVHEDELSPVNVIDGVDVPRQSVFAQLFMTTVVAGIVANIAADAADLLRGRTRVYPHGCAERAAQDPLLLERVGRLSAYAYAAQASVSFAAAELAEVGRIFRQGGNFDQAGDIASFAAANAKLSVDAIAFEAGSILFDVGSASATSGKLALDRHWRNARTISSHNPRVYKAHGIGNHLVNGIKLPRASF